MSNLVVPNIICFQTQKQLATLNNIWVLLKSVLVDLHAHNFVHLKTHLRACCVHGRQCAHNLWSPETSEQKNLYSKKKFVFLIVSSCNKLISRKNVFVTKNFLCGNVYLSHVGNLSVASPEVLFQRCSLMKYRASIGTYSLRVAVLKSATELIFSIAMSYQNVLFQG